MGINAAIQRGDCKGQNDKSAHTESIASWAQKNGKGTGFVTTSRVTHASPGGLYARTFAQHFSAILFYFVTEIGYLYTDIADRNWENDQEVRQSGCDPNETIDIARQLIENSVAQNLKVIFGGGRAEFRNTTVSDEEQLKGLRSDGRDLIKDWLSMHKGKGQYLYEKNNLKNIRSDTEYLLGLFSDDHCEYNKDIERRGLTDKKPTLSEMTKTAIEFLQKEKNGYFLFVEGARIDMAHHENWARIALEETEEFSKTIEMVRNMTNEIDTLIVVTSDHSHTMTYSGYPVNNFLFFTLHDRKLWLILFHLGERQ